MSSPALDDRRREVLRQLIDLHIETGEPVGSEALARALNRAVSSATLRNMMADLEELGYLNHPHTSAGRMPTDEGYRLYVDALMDPRPLAPGAASAIASELRDVSPRQVLEKASHLLSRLSGQVGFVLAPDLAKATFRHLDLVRLSHPRFLVVMVSQSGIATSKIVEVEEPLGPEQLQACANYLNSHFAGLSLAEIHSRLLDLMKQERALYDSLLKSVVALGERAFAASPADKDIYLDGTSNMLDPKVFEDLDRMKALFRTFEEKSRLVRILNACMAGDGLRIVIGRENPEPDLRETSLVTASYDLEGADGFGLGVLGSTRMEYASAVTLVDHVARAVSQMLREMRS
jgi:heat-inducible transcriptional repressor